MQIALTYDLRDDYRALGYNEESIAEFDSLETIEAIENTLVDMGHTVERIGNIWRLTEALASGNRWDLVFNICEGLHGIAREAQVPALLDAYEQPYVFSSPEILVTAHDKSLAKLFLAQAGITTAPWQVIRCEADISSLALPYPLFAKPLAEGTGKGISAKSLIEQKKDTAPVLHDLLERFSQPVLVETYLPGREFTVGLIGSGVEAEAIGVMEIITKPGAEKGGHTFHNKEHCELLMEYKPIDDAVAQAASSLAFSAWKLLGCRDAGRIDIRCDANDAPHFLEVNPLAGLHPTHSDLPILANFYNIDYYTLLSRIIASAMQRLPAQDITNTQQSQSCAY